MNPQKKKDTQQQLSFAAGTDNGFLGNAHSPQALADLGTGALVLSSRARKWLQVHGIKTLGDLWEAHQTKIISQKCFDAQVRSELFRELKLYCKGGKYKYIFGINFLDKGLEEVLGSRTLRSTPITKLDLDSRLKNFLGKKNVVTLGQLLLQPELRWRNPRILGNVLVDEILVSLAMFMARFKK